jgi:Amino acid permease
MANRSAKALANNSDSAAVYIAGVLGGSSGAKTMALAIALSVIATTGTGIVLTARIIYGMASYRVLPEFLSNVSRRYATPVPASIAAPRGSSPGTVIVVPPGQSIQAAVNRAHPGTIIQLKRGVYHQAVQIRTDGITLRGVGNSPNGTVLKPGMPDTWRYSTTCSPRTARESWCSMMASPAGRAMS